MTDMFKYSVAIRWSDEDEGFIATVFELPGLSAFGNTYEEALSELEIASGAFLEALKESGKTLPEPQKQFTYSGQLRLRMPKSLHARLAMGAEEEGVSLNTYLVSLLSERQGKKEAAKDLQSRQVTIVKVVGKSPRETMEATFNYPHKSKPEKHSENWGENISTVTKGGFN